MKNLTRVLALVLTFAMMISTVAMAATFTDIEEGSTYAEATAVLSDLGILYGYEDGTFGADKVITRAEVVAVINRLQGLSDAAKAAGGATQYTDVPSTEWYAGDVNLATQMGIISGDGNGLFRPNDQVKYEEAVKMVVAALGYNQEYVLKRGGWPTGYLVIATEAGVSKGLSTGAGEPAYRGIVAKLAYNALTAPTFAFSSYSTDGKAIYTVNEEKITLEEKLQVTKLTGYVAANALTSLTSASLTDNDEVNFEITAEKVGKVDSTWKKGGNDTFVTATDVADTLGFTTDIYVKENAEGDYEIISYVINNAKNNKIVIEDPSTIQATSATLYASKIEGAADGADEGTSVDNYLSVYDEDVDATNTTYELETDAKLIVNGQKIGAMSASATEVMYDITGANGIDLGLIYAPAYGTVTLIDNDNDGAAEFVFVDSYEVAVVEDVIDSTTSKKIYTNAGTIDLYDHIEGKTGYTYAITLDGKEATIADLQENDVIAVAMTKNKRGYDIIATRSTVSGLISEIDTTVGLKDREFVIDGTAYMVANLNVKTNSDLQNVNVGDEVTFYLDAFNNVAYMKKTSSAAQNYAFILGVGQDVSIGDTAYQVQLLDKEGKVETYTLADNVRFANVAADGTPTSIEAKLVYPVLAALAIDEDNADADSDNTTGKDWILTTNNAANIDKYAKRIVTYKVNSNGKISEIVLGADRVNGKESYITYEGATDVSTAKYSAKTQKLGKYFVDDETVVFNLPIAANATKDKFAIASIASLADEETYDLAYLSVDEDSVAGVVVVVNDGASVASGSNLAVVKKVMTAQNADLDYIYNITFIQNGEEITLPTTADVKSDVTIKAGDVFEYAVDEDGAIRAIALATYEMAAFNGDIDFIDVNFGSAFIDSGMVGYAKEQYVFGVVYTKTSGRVVSIGATKATADTHAIASDANIYLIDLTKAKVSGIPANAITTSSYAEFREYKDDIATGKVIVDNDYAVFMKYYNDEVTDVVVYKGYLTGNYDD